MTMPINSQHKTSSEHASYFLPASEFAAMVKNMPLIAIDLLVEDEKGDYLLGWRSNPPAQSSWFVPGGRIRKNESLANAFMRITQTELGSALKLEQAAFKGVYQHFYAENFLGEQGQSTHYITLAYQLKVHKNALSLPTDQHAHYRWTNYESIQLDPQIHTYTRDYFTTPS
jgi:colanic acid biosynthesis protein WcaH